MLTRSPQLAFSLGLLLVGTLASCSGGAGDPIDAGQVGIFDGAVEPDASVEPDALVEPDAMTGVPAADGQGIDLLFVIDNSNSMREEQASLAANFNLFVDVLQNIDGGLPDVHIGIVTTNVGAGQFPIAGCENNGDNGRLTNTPSGACNTPVDRYISDVAGTDGSRIRNYEGTLAENFSCIAEVGVNGCGFEQPLEAMVRALDGSNPENAGFLRPEALLAVVIISDEDDCSAANSDMYSTDPSLDNISSKLGPLSSFRCFEFGVSCDPDTPRVAGTRSNCIPKQNSPYMDDVSVYSDFLKGLKANPGNVVVAGIIGNPSPVSVILNDGEPKLEASCVSGSGDADPGVRLNGFLEQFPERNTVTTICDEDLSDGLAGIAGLLATIIDN